MERPALPLLLVAGLLLFAAGAPPARAGSTPCDCGTCHGNIHGPDWKGCSTCHEAPPATGSHLAHYNSLPQLIMRYGDTTVSSTDDAYKFGCGNCHPLDRSRHRDGTVEVELYNPLAPPGSLKAKNPPTASYNPTTKVCSNVYCHSGYAVGSSAVGAPLTYPANPVPPGDTLNGSYIMDATCSSLVYPPYTVTSQRVYSLTPPWGTMGSFTTCQECHAFPLTSYYPTVDRGAGDSHQWVASDNWNYGHAWNMSWYDFGPVACRTCHYATVTAEGSSTYSGNPGDIVLYDPVPIASRVTHVNGAPDVAFDTADVVTYRQPYDLTGASYDPSTRTCADVACHYSPTAGGRTGGRWQKEVQWGAPANMAGWGSVECDVCHRYALEPTCQPAP